MKYLCCCIFLLCVSGVVAQTVSEHDPTKNAGKVAWSARKIDFGTVKQGHPVTRTLWLKNLQREKLSLIQVTSSCHCIEVNWDTAPVRKGKRARIDITFQPEAPGDFYRIVAVTTNFDPQQSIAIPVTGKVSAPE